MHWKIDFDKKFEKDLKSLDSKIQKRVLAFIKQKIETNPRRYGKPLQGDKKGLWSYRIGNYRIIGHLKDNKLIVLLVSVGHRKEIYYQ